MKKGFEFLQAMQEIDEELVCQAGKEWKKAKGAGTWRKAACVLLVLLLGIAGIFHEQVEAAIREFTTEIGEWLENGRDLRPYTEVLDQTKEKNGFRVTFREMVIDQDKVFVRADLEKEGKEEDETLLLDVEDVKLDGRSLGNHDAATKQDGEGRYLALAGYRNVEFPEDFSKVECILKAGAYKGSSRVGSAKFRFAFRTSRQEMLPEKRTEALDFQMELAEGTKVRFEEISWSEVTGKVRVVFDGEIDFSHEHYWLKVRDEEGNESVWSTSSYMESTRMMELGNTEGTMPDLNTGSLTLTLYRSAEKNGWKEERVGSRETELPERGMELTIPSYTW